MRRCLAAVLLVLQGSCMTTWQSSRLSPEQTVAETPRVRVKLRDGRHVELREAWARNDSIGGYRMVRSGSRWVKRARVVPLDSVEVLEVRQPDLPFTLAAGTAIIVVTLGVLLVIYYETDVAGCVATPCFD